MNIADLSESLSRFLPTTEVVEAFPKSYATWLEIRAELCAFSRLHVAIFKDVYTPCGAAPQHKIINYPQAITPLCRVCSFEHISAICAAQCV